MTLPPRKIDEAAFGVVYGSITVIALLMAMRRPVEAPGQQALILFCSVFAVAVAKAYAEICERMLQTGYSAQWSDFQAVWQHSKTVLIAANGPALALGLAALGVYSAETAFLLAQVLALALLVYFGTRIGRRTQGTAVAGLLGGALTGGIGMLVSLVNTQPTKDTLPSERR